MIPAMETMPIPAVRARLAELVAQVETQRDRVTITRDGKPAAILISADEWESVHETLDVLADREALPDLKESADAYARGEIYSSADIAVILHARAQLRASESPGAD